MRTLIATIVMCVAPIVSSAGPINFLKRQFRDHPLRTQLVYAAAASSVYAVGLHQCRSVNVENCQEHYGAAWGGYGATVSLNLVSVLVGHKLGGKMGSISTYSGSTAILGWGAYQWHGGLNKPAEH